MNKPAFRIIALFLVPSLIADPALAHQSVSDGAPRCFFRHALEGSLFDQEAMALAQVTAERSLSPQDTIVFDEGATRESQNTEYFSESFGPVDPSVRAAQTSQPLHFISASYWGKIYRNIPATGLWNRVRAWCVAVWVVPWVQTRDYFYRDTAHIIHSLRSNKTRLTERRRLWSVRAASSRTVGREVDEMGALFLFRYFFGPTDRTALAEFESIITFADLTSENREEFSVMGLSPGFFLGRDRQPYPIIGNIHYMAVLENLVRDAIRYSRPFDHAIMLAYTQHLIVGYAALWFARIKITLLQVFMNALVYYRNQEGVRAVIRSPLVEGA